MESSDEEESSGSPLPPRKRAAVVDSRHPAPDNLSRLLQKRKEEVARMQQAQEEQQRLHPTARDAPNHSDGLAPTRHPDGLAPPPRAPTPTAAAAPTSIFSLPPRLPAIAPLPSPPHHDAMRSALCGGGAAALLSDGWVLAAYSAPAAPPADEPLLRWLLAAACYHSQPAAAHGAAAALAALLSPPRAAAWSPAPEDVREALRHFGADLLRTLAARWAARPSAQLVVALRLLLVLMVDEHAAPAFVELKGAVAVLLDGMPAWEGWVCENVWELVRPLKTLPHAQLAHMCEGIPSTSRGAELQAEASLAVIALLIDHEQAAATEGGLVPRLCCLLEQVNVSLWKEQMSKLYSVLQLVDLALSRSASTSQDIRTRNGELSKMKNCLRKVKQKILDCVANSDSRDCEAMITFLSSKIEHFFSIPEE
ncbi:hypothetical protein AB1Y20_006011 [Prymnesium parvum]|uniref:Uncharacterized protein n=1 Tax=Prymnesium parvum TaxID=97485 RepID=A0AB34J2R3_PRYPA